MFIPSVFKSVNQYSILGTSSGNNDKTITSVNVNNTIIIPGGFASRNASGFGCGNGSGYLTLLNATTVRAFCLSIGDIYFTALEFYPGFLKQAVQYTTITMSNATSGNVTITTVGSKAFVIALGMYQDSSNIQADMASVTYDLNLNSSTQVTGTRYGTGGAAGSPDVATIGLCVVDPR